MTRWKWIMLAAVMLFAAFATSAAAESSEKGRKLTAEEKLQALKEAGVFKSNDESENLLEKNMSRVEYLVQLVNLYVLEDVEVEAPPFSDVPLDNWAVDEIARAKEAGIVRGNPDGTFNPNGNITIQELAVVTAQSLGLDPVEDSEVPGASEWAQGYINALLQNGITLPQNYTEPATLRDLIDVTYDANQIHTEQNGIGLTKVEQSGASRISVGFNGEGRSAGADFTIARIGEEGVRTEIGIESVEWSEIGYMAVVRLSEPLQGGVSYEVTLTGSDSIDPDRNSAVFVAEPERADSLKWGGPDTLPYADHVEVPFQVLNQFGEPMDAPDMRFTFSAQGTSIERIPDRTAVLLHLRSKAKPGDSIRLTVKAAGTQASASRVYQVGEEPVIKAVEIDGAAGPLEARQSADLIVRVYDQYGFLIRDAEWLNGEQGVAASSDNPRAASVSSIETDGDGNTVVRVTAGIIGSEETVTITVSDRAGTVSAQTSVTVKASSVLALVTASPSLPPAANPTVNDSVYTVGSNFAYVTVSTEDAVRVYYYYEKKDASPAEPSAAEVRSRALEGLQGGSAIVSSDRTSFVLYELAPGHDYELFVTAADTRDRLSEVQTYAITAGYLSSYVRLMEDPLDPSTGRCVVVMDNWLQPNPEVYYLLGNEPIPDATADEIRARGTKANFGMFTFQVTGQVQYLYVAYEIDGDYELFAYASDTFPDF